MYIISTLRVWQILEGMHTLQFIGRQTWPKRRRRRFFSTKIAVIGAYLAFLIRGINFYLLNYCWDTNKENCISKWSTILYIHLGCQHLKGTCTLKNFILCEGTAWIRDRYTVWYDRDRIRYVVLMMSIRKSNFRYLLRISKVEESLLWAIYFLLYRLLRNRCCESWSFEVKPICNCETM